MNLGVCVKLPQDPAADPMSPNISIAVVHIPTAGKGFRGKGFEEKVPAPGKKDKFHTRAQHGELSHCRALC